MADDPIKDLGNKTPLQYASTPTLDWLANSGVLGTAITIPEGMHAGSDTAILSILGLNPQDYFSGRAPLEAAATDIKLSSGDVAYRCNMLSIEDGDKPFEEKLILSHSAGSIEGKESNELIIDLFNTPAFKKPAEKAGLKIHPGSSFRHLAVQASRGTGTLLADKARCLSPCLLSPPHDHLDEVLGQYLPKGEKNAELLKNLIQLSNEILDDHPINKKRRSEGKLPANCIWFWAEGTAVELPKFNELYGKTGSVISAVPLCRGIGVLMGLEKILVSGATGELNTNYEGKVDAAVKSLENKDFTLLHVEAPDECTHNGDLEGKLQAIEWIDSRILMPLLKQLNDDKTDFRMLVMSDHRTLLSTRGHDSGPVPYVIYDSRHNAQSGLKFCESDAQRTKPSIDGIKLMSLLFEEQAEI